LPTLKKTPDVNKQNHWRRKPSFLKQTLITIMVT